MPAMINMQQRKCFQTHARSHRQKLLPVVSGQNPGLESTIAEYVYIHTRDLGMRLFNAAAVTI